ncbi:MAG TPA: DUF1552 domain-containing protein [Bryobacteraceae bacterium]|nr:DUF1552 domain-containing protein [Bryobacteraceae bacterium]
MIVTKKHIDRRRFLRGVGTALALPFLDAMTPAFAGPNHGGARPIRLGFVYVPNGIIDLKGEWTPAGSGADFTFAPTMRALEPFREHLLVLTNLAQLNGRALGDGPGDHARAGATWLTGVHPKKTEGAEIHAGISADQVAARELGAVTQFASLELGLEAPGLVGNCDSGYSCAYTNTVSWRSASTPMPPEVNPRTLFERLFGDGDSTDRAARMARLREQRSILDFVLEDAAELKAGLGAKDRNKLSEYLEAVRDIERRIEKAEKQNLQMPALDRPAGVPDDFEEHARLMMDMEVAAFQTDMTRVVTLMMAREGSNRSYRQIGVPDGHHSCTHHDYDPEKIAKTTKINEYHVRMFAYLLERLKATPEGEGSLLDNSLILYGSSINDGNKHTHDKLPLVLAGGGGGKVKGGRHLVFPNETPMNNLLLSMLDKAGVKAHGFGDSTGPLEGLSEL